MKREDCRRRTDELFSQKQADVLTRRAAHRSEIYEKFPQILETERRMESVSAEFFSKMADGDLSEEEFEKLKTESLALQNERENTDGQRLFRRLSLPSIRMSRLQGRGFRRIGNVYLLQKGVGGRIFALFKYAEDISEQKLP